MRFRSHRKSVYFFTVFGICLVAVAVALNVGWLIVNRQIALLIFGAIFFALLIAGVTLNTIYLVREIRRNEQQDSFLNAVTHELKTPIASVRLYLETLQTREIDDARRHEFYRIMLDDTERLSHTVEQVLRASRTSHRRRQIQKSIINVGELANECLNIASKRPQLENTSLKYVESSHDHQPIYVEGDADELRTAISNLIDNAIKYSNDNVEVIVDVSSNSDGRAFIRVIDNGMGIPPGEAKRIFNRFYRAPRRVVSKVKGTGLGLFIVQAVVKKHGGQTFAESRGEGHGSIFTIILPRIG